MITSIDRALRTAIPARYRKYWRIGQGCFEFFAGRTDPDEWGGPFNGQAGRREIFDALVRLQKPGLIVETGTYRGTTTQALAAIGVPVISIENDRRNYGFARTRLRRLRNVSVRLGDSRQVMRELFRGLAPVANPGGLFAYLDAHWYQDLPLGEELDIAFSWDPAAIVMIDDFQVPDDAGYGYDGYAGLKAEYIEPVLRAHRLVALYPTLPSSREGGSKRGCVVLASEERWKSTLLSTGLLRQIAQGSPISSS